MPDKYLEDLENRLNPETEDEIERQWLSFINGGNTADIFSPKRVEKAPAQIKWPEILINNAFESMELMLLRELAAVSGVLASGGGDVLNIRCNYGTGIVPSLFGLNPFFMEDKHDTLPTFMPAEGGSAAISRMVSAGVPSLDRGLAPKVFDTLAYFQDKLSPYPKLKRYCHIYHPDLQGPADAAEVIWGSGIFMAFYDEPGLLLDFLRLLTDTYKVFMHRWEDASKSECQELHCHWGFAFKGRIVLRDDSLMNLSPETCAEFIIPFDRELLTEFGGGVVHACGRTDHYLRLLSDTGCMTGFQLSQPEYNDMEEIFRQTVDRGIALLRLNRAAAEAALQQGRDLHHLVHC